MDLSQYAELFLAESREHLTNVNQLLLEWERDPAATAPVTGVFRSVHTIKGMAATMGYGPVADLAHRMENLLDLLRRANRPVTEATLELLFRSADALDDAIERSVAGRHGEVEVGELLAAVDRAAAAMEPEVARPAAARPPAPVKMAPGGPGRTVRVTLSPDAPLKGARAQLILRRLELLGSVHAVEPPATVLESEQFDGRFSCRLVSPQADTDIVQLVRGAGDVEAVEIGPEEVAPHIEPTAARTRHIRVDLRRLDALMNLIGELVTLRGRLGEVATRAADPDLEEVNLRVSRLASELQNQIIQARMTPVWQVFDRFPRLVRDLSRQLGKKLVFRVEGKEIELDRAILDEIGDPLLHLLRNAVDHGIEPPQERLAAGKPEEGVIELSAVRERATVAIQVRDDGRGIDRAKILAKAKARGFLGPEADELTDEMLVRVLARSGFTTVATVSDVSGRGVGIDVVADRVRALGGALEAESTPGRGTAFTLRLPITLAIVRALITRVADEQYALPLTHVAETVDLDTAAVTRVDGRDAMVLREDVVPLVHLRRLLEVSGERPARSPVIVLQIGPRRSGLVVDQLMGQQEIVVKSFTPPRGTLSVFSGATILQEGQPALILDAGGLV